MQIQVKPGKYVVAISGGVDSMVLLRLLYGQEGLELIVAHFDHGIRPDSAQDRQLVQATAADLGLPFVYANGRLGEQASEAVARKVRYDFLYATQQEYGAKAIVTAHHQDDVLETAIINMLRGTNRRGLSSLKSTDGIVRPLLDYPKQALLEYARAQGIVWHEDSTNRDERYVRNYIRRQLLARFSDADRRQFAAVLTDSARLNHELDALIAQQLQAVTDDNHIRRQRFTDLPHAIAREVMAAWLRTYSLEFDKATIERLVVAAKTAQPGSSVDVTSGWQLHITKTTLALRHPER